MRPLKLMHFQEVSPLSKRVLLFLGICLPFEPLNALESSFLESHTKNWSRLLNKAPLVSSPTEKASCGGNQSNRSPAGEPSLQTCTDDPIAVGNIQGRTSYVKVSESERLPYCIATAQTKRTPENKYRYYQATGWGLFYVYNEFDPTASNSRSNETHTYFIYPIRNSVQFGEKRLKLPSGHLIHFNEEGDVSQIEGCDYALDTQITNPSNRSRSSIPGGLQIEQCENSIVIDSGSQIGNLSFRRLSQNSTVRDATGKTCQVLNSKLFRAIPLIDSDTGRVIQAVDEVVPNYQSSSELVEILSQNCPELDLSPLR